MPCSDVLWDRITHVLVGKPFDTSSSRSSTSPSSPRGICGCKRKDLGGARGGDRLGESLVALHALLEIPETPQLLRAGFRLSGPFGQSRRPAMVRFDAAQHQVWIGDNVVDMVGREQPLFAFLHERALRREPLFPDHYTPVTSFAKFLESWAAQHPEYSFKDRSSGRDWRKDLDNSSFRGPFSSLRNKLSAAGGAKLFPSRKGQLGLLLRTTLFKKTFSKILTTSVDVRMLAGLPK